MATRMEVRGRVKKRLRRWTFCFSWLFS